MTSCLRSTWMMAMWSLLLERFQELDELPALFVRQRDAVVVPGIAVARHAGVQFERHHAWKILETHLLGIELAAADKELRFSNIARVEIELPRDGGGRRQQHLVKRAHRAVMQVRPGRPDAVQRPRLVVALE